MDITYFFDFKSSMDPLTAKTIHVIVLYNKKNNKVYNMIYKDCAGKSIIWSPDIAQEKKSHST